MATDKEFISVLRELWPENRMAVIVCAITGRPICEVLRLRSDQLTPYGVTFDDGDLVSLPADVCKALRRISGVNFIFSHRFYADRTRTRQAVYKDIKRACKDIGVAASITPGSVARMRLFLQRQERQA